MDRQPARSRPTREVPAEIPPDLRLVPGTLALWAGNGVCLGLPPPAALAGGGCVLAVAGLLLLSWRRRWTRILAGALACAAAGASVAGIRVAGLLAGPVPELAGQSVVAELVVTGDPERGEPRVRGSALARAVVTVPARLVSVTSGRRTYAVRSPVIVRAYGPGWSDLVPSTRVRVSGRLGPGRPERGVVATLTPRGPVAVVAGPSRVQELAGRLRSGLRGAVGELPPDVRGLVPALVVGDTSGMPADLVEDFRTAGLSHVTAVSGFNVAVVFGVALLAARWCGLTRTAPLVGAAAIAGFVLLARPQPSVLRAAAMGLLTVVALLTGRRKQAVSALCVAVLVLLLADPWLARSYGFALSVLATCGILLLAPRWRAALARRLPGPLADGIVVPAAAEVACAPVVAMLSAHVSLVAIPANLLAAPAVAPATIFGLLATLAAPIHHGAAELLGRLAGLAARWIVTVARHAAALPGAAVSWPGGVTGAVTLAGVLLVVLLLAPYALRHRAVTALTVALVAVWAVRPVLPDGWPPRGWVAVACDVGQGDALVLAAGEGVGIVVDTGPDPRAVDRCLRDLGVRRVPLILLTHFHADHVEGLPGVLRGRHVGEIEVGLVPEPRGEVRRVERWARAAGVPVTRAAIGEQRRIGDLSWRVLWPARVIRGEGSVPNNASLVVLAERAGVRMLLTGDLETAAQRALLQQEPTLRADVLKVPHHGSAFQDPRLTWTVQPRLALIPVGRDNPYGHPAPSTLVLLRATGARVLRTDTDGEIAVVGSAGRLGVVTRSTSKRRARRRRFPGPPITVAAEGCRTVPGTWNAGF
ncbi:hypothetical protein C3Y87_00375 [Carbonactinospora thermoautotrophica]|nr:hypothetical protein [Carbonactinospora thermoautotrophica]